MTIESSTFLRGRSISASGSVNNLMKRKDGITGGNDLKLVFPGTVWYRPGQTSRSKFIGL